jgi:hypothetical protein
MEDASRRTDERGSMADLTVSISRGSDMYDAFSAPNDFSLLAMTTIRLNQVFGIIFSSFDKTSARYSFVKLFKIYCV